MFVKVAYARDEITSVYECRRIHVLNLKGTAESKPKVIFELENDGTNEAIRIDVEKDSGTEVYLMNDEGKTIDVYRWQRTTPIDVGID